MSETDPKSPAPNVVHRAIVVALAVSFLVVPYLFSFSDREGAALGNELVYDGLQLVTQHETLVAVQQDPSIGNLAATLTAPWWGQIHPDKTLYRPIPLFLLGVCGALAGEYDFQDPSEAPFPYHVIVVALNAFCALLVLELAWTLLGNARMAFLAGALFAVLPVHGEVLFDVAGIAELCATAFGLAAWRSWVHAGRAWREGGARSGLPPLLASAVLLLGATLSKESAFLLPLVFLLSDVGLAPEGGFAGGLRHALRRVPGLALCGVVLAVSLALRLSVVGELVPEYHLQARFDNPLIGESAFVRVMNGLRLMAASIPILVGINPLASTTFGFSPDYSFAQVKVLGALSPWNLLGALVVVGAIAAAIKLYPRGRLCAALVLTFFASLLIASNLLFATGTIFAERLLFFPSVAFVLLVAAFLGRAGVPGLALGVLLAFGAAFWNYQRSSTWANQGELWVHASTVSATESARAKINAAVDSLNDNLIGLAVTDLEDALAIAPEYSWAHYQLAVARASEGSLEEAADHFQEAFELMIRDTGRRWEPSDVVHDFTPHGLLHYVTYLRRGELDQAEEHLAWLNGLIEGGYESPHAYWKKAETLNALGRAREAEEAYRASIAIEPITEAVLSFALMLRAYGRYDEAYELVRGFEGWNTESERVEVLLQRADLEMRYQPERVLAIVEEVLHGSDPSYRLADAQVFKAKLLQAQARLSIYERDPAVAPDDLELIERDLKQAISAWRVQNDDTFAASTMLVDVLLMQRENDEARRLIEGILATRQVPTPTLRAKLGRILRMEGEDETALHQLQRATDEMTLEGDETIDDVVLMEARRELLRCYRDLGRTDELEEEVARWHERAESEYSFNGLYSHSLYLASIGEFEAARERASRIVEHFPDRQIGTILVDLFERVLELEARLAAGELELDGARELLAYLIDELAAYEVAIPVAERALELASDTSDDDLAFALSRLATAREGAGDAAGALEDVRRALSLEDVSLEGRAMLEMQARSLELAQS